MTEIKAAGYRYSQNGLRIGFSFRSIRIPFSIAVAVIALPVLLASSGANPSGQSTEPVIITAGENWIQLKAELDIEVGSALDFSGMGFVDPPAGKHGRMIARSDGQFAFAQSPETAWRFYGVNLCFGAHYLAHEEADRLADRLVRLGYNAVRMHHYERDLVAGQADSVTLNLEKLEKFDYLVAALSRRGIYLSTDLFVSRPVPYRELDIDRNGLVPMNTFKILVPVHPRAWENWRRFSRALLTHVNPYTGKRYADDAALAWLVMITLSKIPPKAAWLFREVWEEKALECVTVLRSSQLRSGTWLCG